MGKIQARERSENTKEKKNEGSLHTYIQGKTKIDESLY
jgi:hypothetical protein